MELRLSLIDSPAARLLFAEQFALVALLRGGGVSDLGQEARSAGSISVPMIMAYSSRRLTGVGWTWVAGTLGDHVHI